MSKLLVVQCPANYAPLSPIYFLEKAARAYGERVSIIYNDHVRFCWREIYERCVRLASSLVNFGISRDDVVAALAPNIPALYELHFSVPMAGAILSALNTKLDATTLALILEQLQPCKLIFVDYQFIDSALKAFDIMSQRKCKPPIIVLIPEYDQQSSFLVNDFPPSTLNYKDLVAKGEPNFESSAPLSESDPISVNFTSGSTGIPKGAIYSHRGTYLNSLATIARFNMKKMPVFLWTVDMFRCNGWCFPWAIAALGGTNICLRNNFSAKGIFNAIHLHKVTHFCGAPALLDIIADSISSPSEHQRPLPHRVSVIVAGVLPPFQVINKVSQHGFDVKIGYGMTEVLGPVTLRQWNPNSDDELAKMTIGEQVVMDFVQDVDVKDPITMESTPNDGKTIGEVMIKGNATMLGYLKNSQGTENAFKGGWYRTRDLAIRQQNGTIRLKDRANDIIYSKGEAVSSLEIEAVLLNHPKVLKVAVVGIYDDDSPCAIVKLKDDSSDATVEDIIKFCKAHLANHMVPRSIFFGDLPVNSTGKVQKFLIREKIKNNEWCDSMN